MTDLLILARKLIRVVRAAGEMELHYFRSSVEVMDKLDGSPVTLADQEAEALIAKELHEICPDTPMIGEESVAAGTVPDIAGGEFWLVDPLDGTREFITGSGDFTVNIALLRNRIPVMGIIYAPVADELYFGAEGQAFMSLQGKSEQKISVRQAPAEGLTVVASKRHGDPERLKEFLKNKKVVQLTNRSSSLKFCLIAAGLADLYPRLGPTSEWDTAAGDAILRAAGGRVTMLDGTPLVYGKVERKFLNPEFIASGM
ncbi:MAG: 3'(2'),5'-bisphosphate nucleotidase CysQ [Proteobacteria bacterium]|nr:3'(2'),5'-bisphosphate nucleotidase CysQ [Pseudomonadota bacterium]